MYDDSVRTSSINHTQNISYIEMKWHGISQETCFHSPFLPMHHDNFIFPFPLSRRMPCKWCDVTPNSHSHLVFGGSPQRTACVMALLSQTPGLLPRLHALIPSPQSFTFAFWMCTCCHDATAASQIVRNLSSISNALFALLQLSNLFIFLPWLLRLRFRLVPLLLCCHGSSRHPWPNFICF